MTDSRDPWLSFRLRKAQSDEPVAGWYGGHPRGVLTHEWPRCRVCAAPMCHMMQINAGPWVDLGRFQRLSVFICHATGGRCEDWDPWAGSNCVLLHENADDAMYDGPPTVRVYRRKQLTVDAPLDERALMAAATEAGRPVREVLPQLKHDKLGGGAVWLAGDGTPQSRAGRGPMRLVWQFTTNVIPFDITEGGMGYIFIDSSDSSGDAAVMVWQGA